MPETRHCIVGSCAVSGCEEHIVAYGFCARHWLSLPRELNRAFTRAPKGPSPERQAAHAAARIAALEWLGEHPR